MIERRIPPSVEVLLIQVCYQISSVFLWNQNSRTAERNWEEARTSVFVNSLVSPGREDDTGRRIGRSALLVFLLRSDDIWRQTPSPTAVAGLESRSDRHLGNLHWA